MAENESGTRVEALETAAGLLRIAEESAAIAARFLEIAGTPELDDEAEIQGIPAPISRGQRASPRIAEQVPRIRRLSSLLSQQTAWVQSLSSQFAVEPLALEQLAAIQSLEHSLSQEIARLERFLAQPGSER